MADNDEATPYDDHSTAVDAAVLLLIRKLGRLVPNTLDGIAAQLPPGAWEVLMAAEARADAARHTDQAAGITRTFEF